MKKSLLALAMLAMSSSAFSEVVIKFSHVTALNTPKGQMAAKFKELVEERSHGDIKVQVFPNSQLYNDDKVIEALVMGDVQMAAPSLSLFGKLTKKLQVFDLPFLFDDMDAVDRFQKGTVGQGLLHSMEDKGIVGLGYLHNGLKQFSANKAITLPSDMKGLKFRIQPSDVLAAQMNALGAVAVKKPFAEVFTLLQTKSIDGQESPWSNTYSQKFYEVQPFITNSNHGPLDYMLVTSKKFLDSLTPEQKKIVEDSVTDADDYGNSLSDKMNQEDLAAIKASGYSKIIEITPEQRKQWVEAMRPVWKKFESQIGADVIAAAEASNQN